MSMRPSGVVVGNSCKENDKTKIRKKRAFRVYLYQKMNSFAVVFKVFC